MMGDSIWCLPFVQSLQMGTGMLDEQVVVVVVVIAAAAATAAANAITNLQFDQCTIFLACKLGGEEKRSGK